VILHYACATFEQWLAKYHRLGQFSDYWYDDPTLPIQLPFHLESRNVVRECADAGDMRAAFDLFKRELLTDSELCTLISEGKVAQFAPLKSMENKISETEPRYQNRWAPK